MIRREVQRGAAARALPMPRTTYAAWRAHFATCDLAALRRQADSALALAHYDRYVCVHVSTALRDEIAAREEDARPRPR